MTGRPIQEFLWANGQPINYDRNKQRWPRSQTLPRYHAIDSAVFLSTAKIYRQHSDRIGNLPYIMENGWPGSLDINWPDEWWLAEHLWQVTNGNDDWLRALENRES